MAQHYVRNAIAHDQRNMFENSFVRSSSKTIRCRAACVRSIHAISTVAPRMKLERKCCVRVRSTARFLIPKSPP